MMATLYERLGGTAGITQIAHDIVDLHLQNTRVATRFETSDIVALKHAVSTFFIAGTGGPNEYRGEDMLTAHKHMNIDQAEFMAVLDDALKALTKNGVGQREQEEVLFILYSMRGEVVRV